MLEGNLQNLPITEVLTVVSASRKSGVLSVEHGGQLAKLVFREGRMSVARLEPGVDPLEVAVRLGLLTVREALTALAQARATGDGILPALSAATRDRGGDEALRLVLQAHLRWVVAEMMGWRSGGFSVREAGAGELPVTGAGTFETMSLLLSATGRLSGAESQVSSREVFRRSGDPRKTTLPDGAWDLLALVDGKRSAATLAAELELSEPHTYSLLHSLRGSGVIESLPFQAQPPVVLALAPGNAMQRLLRLLLHRNRAGARLLASADRLSMALREERVRALVVDDECAGPWELVRELRRRKEAAHLPILVLGAPEGGRRLLGRMKRSRALNLSKPFDELEFAQTIERMTPARLT